MSGQTGCIITTQAQCRMGVEVGCDRSGRVWVKTSAHWPFRLCLIDVPAEGVMAGQAGLRIARSCKAWWQTRSGRMWWLVGLVACVVAG